MNRNSDAYFSQVPSRVDMPRSILPRNQEIVFTGSVGELIPFYVDEVLPGSTHQIDTAKVVRMQTPITPFFGDVFLDTYYFFVPNRLTWEHWQEFCGENKTSAWIPDVEYTIPQIESPTLNGVSYGWNNGTIADYMGIPTNVPNLSINALPFRAYALICNEFFRDENLTDPLNIPLNDSTVIPDSPGLTSDNYINAVAQGLLPFKVSKLHDQFTSSLPGPAKTNETIGINLDALSGTNLNVIGNGKAMAFDAGSTYQYILGSGQGDVITRNGQATAPDAGSTATSWGGNPTSNLALGLSTSQSNVIAPLDDISSKTLMTISQLRTAFQVQKYYERLGNSGSRYIEILASMFGVRSPDQRLQRPEYLGGNRCPINVSQVVQTSQTSSTPQGNVSGLSVTSDYHSDFTKSFVEHGYIIGVCCIRYRHMYQQGLERMWSRNTKFDFYWPLFANISNQPIYNREIYAQGSGEIDSKTGDPYDDEVFGYQEAWFDYRYKPNRVSAEMRSNYSQSLDIWHLGDDYDNLPSLSDSWIREDPSPLDRVIAVSQKGYDSFLFDVLVKNKTTQPMPVYSIPGLVDHH